MNPARLSLYVVGVVFLGLGAMSLIAPMNLTALVEIAMPTRIAVMEVRGVYGGFFFGTGFFFLLFARHEAWFRPGLIAQASIFGGFVLGRAVGIAIGGSSNAFIAVLLFGEIVGLVVALVSLRQLSRSTGA